VVLSPTALRVAALTTQKLSEKAAIKIWLDHFKEEHGRAAGAQDKAAIDPLYAQYKQTSSDLDAAQKALGQEEGGEAILAERRPSTAATDPDRPRSRTSTAEKLTEENLKRRRGSHDGKDKDKDKDKDKEGSETGTKKDWNLSVTEVDSDTDTQSLASAASLPHSATSAHSHTPSHGRGAHPPGDARLSTPMIASAAAGMSTPLYVVKEGEVDAYTDTGNTGKEQVAQTAPAKVVGPRPFSELPTPSPVAEPKAVMHTAPGHLQSKPEEQDSPWIYLDNANENMLLDEDGEAAQESMEAVHSQLNMLTLKDLSPKKLEMLGYGGLKPHKFRQLAIKNAPKYGKDTIEGRYGKDTLDIPLLSPATLARNHMVAGNLHDLQYSGRTKDAMPRQRAVVKQKEQEKTLKEAEEAARKEEEKRQWRRLGKGAKWKLKLDRLKAEQDKAEEIIANRPAFALRSTKAPPPGQAAWKAWNSPQYAPTPMNGDQNQLGASVSSSSSRYMGDSNHNILNYNTNDNNVHDQNSRNNSAGSKNQFGLEAHEPHRVLSAASASGAQWLEPTGPGTPPPSHASPRHSHSHSTHKHSHHHKHIASEPQTQVRDKKRTMIRIKIDRIRVSGLGLEGKGTDPILRFSLIGSASGSIGTTGSATIVPAQQGNGTAKDGKRSDKEMYSYVEVFSSEVSEFDLENGAEMQVEVLDKAAAAAAGKKKQTPQLISLGICHVKDGFHIKQKKMCIVRLDQRDFYDELKEGEPEAIIEHAKFSATEHAQAIAAASAKALQSAKASATEALAQAQAQAQRALANTMAGATKMASGAFSALSSASSFLGKAGAGLSSFIPGRRASTAVHTVDAQAAANQAAMALALKNIADAEAAVAEAEAAEAAAAAGDHATSQALSRSASVKSHKSMSRSASAVGGFAGELMFRSFAIIEQEVFLSPDSEEGDGAGAEGKQLEGALEAGVLKREGKGEGEGEILSRSSSTNEGSGDEDGDRDGGKKEGEGPVLYTDKSGDRLSLRSGSSGPADPELLKLRLAQKAILLSKHQAQVEAVRLQRKMNAAKKRAANAYADDEYDDYGDDDAMSGEVQKLMDHADEVILAASAREEADNPTLSLFKLLMKNHPEGLGIGNHDPSSPIPFSKLNAKKLDISENGPLARNCKRYAKPWLDKPFVPAAEQKNYKSVNVAKCALSLHPLPRDLLYSPSISVISASPVSFGQSQVTYQDATETFSSVRNNVLGDLGGSSIASSITYASNAQMSQFEGSGWAADGGYQDRSVASGSVSVLAALPSVAENEGDGEEA